MFFFQAEDGIRDLVRSRGLGDVYKRQIFNRDSKTSVVGVPSALLFVKPGYLATSPPEAVVSASLRAITRRNEFAVVSYR